MMPFDSEFLYIYINLRVHFVLALTVFVMLTFQYFDLENIGEDYKVQHLHCKSMSIKVIIEHFSLTLTILEMLSFQIL